MAQIDSRLGDMIRSYREKLGLTQEEMAERFKLILHIMEILSVPHAIQAFLFFFGLPKN